MKLGVSYRTFTNGWVLLSEMLRCGDRARVYRKGPASAAIDRLCPTEQLAGVVVVCLHVEACRRMAVVVNCCEVHILRTRSIRHLLMAHLQILLRQVGS